MATGLNTLIGQGKPIVEFNIYSQPRQRAVRGRTLGRRLGDPRKMVRQKMGGASATGKVIIGTCAPGFPALVDRINGVKKGLGAGLTIKGPFDVTATRPRTTRPGSS